MKNKLLIHFDSKDTKENILHVYSFEEEPSLSSVVKIIKSIEAKTREMPYFFVLLEEEKNFDPYQDQMYFINAKIIDKVLFDDERFKDLAENNNCSKIVLLERDNIIKLAYPYKKIDKTITIA